MQIQLEEWSSGEPLVWLALACATAYLRAGLASELAGKLGFDVNDGSSNEWNPPTEPLGEHRQ
jgi:hypothetical protein